MGNIMVVHLSDFLVQVWMAFLRAIDRRTSSIEFLELPICSCNIYVNHLSVFSVGWMQK